MGLIHSDAIDALNESALFVLFRFKRSQSVTVTNKCFSVFDQKSVFADLSKRTFSEIFISSVIATLIGVINCFGEKKLMQKLLLKLVCSFVSCSLALLCVKYSLVHQVDKIIIGNVMTLIPGVGLTNAIRDLFVGDVNTGILRLIDAILLGSAIAAGYVLSALMIGGI